MTDEVTENPALHRFELSLGEDDMALAYYSPVGNRVVLTHTEVPYQYTRRGIGSRLAKGVFDSLRKTGRKAVVSCSFLKVWASRHPEYNDVMDG